MIISTAITISIICLNGGFAEYVNQTELRLSAEPSLGANDNREKDYAWGDLDLDGDIDLVCVRKEPFTTTGRNANVLFMNQNGVLVDRTKTYATNTDVEGDLGFLTPTNDRDVILYDLNNNGWLDMVTVTTLTDYDDKHISHPRIYMNLGEIDGEWQGFRFENNRIPEMHNEAGPRFCSLAIEDLTGDGHPDLYFGDYDSGTTQVHDYNNRLLINNGNAYFSDQSTQRMTDEMLLSAFGAASEIADMNGDGVLDVVKQTSLNPPQHIAITYNNPNNEGYFNGYDIIDELAPYFVTVGDLNDDGRLDLVVVDDGSDHYYLNTGNGGDGFADFESFTFENSSGFGGNAIIRDLNNDGHNDVIVTDVDVDIAGCSRTTHIYRNLGNTPDVSMSEQYVGISGTELQGVHDVAVFDINGDGWLDLVMGRCESTEVWIQEPPYGILFSYPSGLPGFIPPNQEWTFTVDMQILGEGSIDPSTAILTMHVDGVANEYPMEPLDKTQFEATIPALDCAVETAFKVSVELNNGSIYSDPPTGWYDVIIGEGTEIEFRDEFEGDVSSWSIVNSKTLETGAWEQADPNGTIYNTQLAAPEDDATGGSQNVMCFVTQNADPNESVGFADVDNGSTTLISPNFNIEGSDGIFSYARWHFDSQSSDSLKTYISNDGGNTWTFVHETFSTNANWEDTSFAISNYVEPTAKTRIAFLSEDLDPQSVVESGIDNVQLEVIVCGGDAVCIGDVDNNGNVNVNDALIIIGNWGTTDPDIDGDGVVAIGDLLLVIGNWGNCE